MRWGLFTFIFTCGFAAGILFAAFFMEFPAPMPVSVGERIMILEKRLNEEKEKAQQENKLHEVELQ